MTAEAQGVGRISKQLDLQALIETIPALVVCALADGSAEFANRAWHEYTGRSSPERTGTSWQTAIHPDDLPKLIQEWTVAAAGMLETEARVRRADGEYQWFAIRKALAISRDQVGKPSLRALIACEDIQERKQAQARLEQNEQRWQTAFENSAIGIVMPDRAGRFFAANRAFRSMLGYTESELYQLSLIDVTYEEDRQLSLELIGELWEGKRQHFEIEKRYRRKDSAPVWTRTNVTLVPGTGSVAPFLFGIVEDITQFKKEESARRSIEQRYRVMVQTANDAVVCMDENGTVVLANPATKRVFGYEPAELIGKPLTVLMPEYLRKLHEDGYRRYLATGQRHINWQGTELTGLRKNGQEFPVEISFAEVTAEGHTIFTGFVRDISEKKQAEEALRRSEERWRAVFENSTIGVALVDMNGRFMAANSAYQSIVGYSEDELRSLTYLDLTHEDYRQMNFQQVEELKAGTKTQFQMEKQYKRKDGSLRWVRNNVSLVPGSELMPQFFIGLVEDITERKWAEEERERLRQAQAELAHMNRVSTMGELTASLAHEINQPIGAAVTNAQACLRFLNRDQPDVPVAREAALEMVRDATRAADIIDRVRSLYRKGSLKLEIVDVNEVIGEMVVILHDEANRSSVKMHTDLCVDIPDVLVDRVQLQQVLMNLMINGIEAMRGSGGELSIKSQLAEDGQLVISVSDMGIGLPAGKADEIFNAFFTTKPQGTGLGLAITRSIVESHGGRVWATGNTPRGATFQFTLPAKKAAHE